jgi:chromosomal replication initiation ATPase DnaA
MSEIENRCLALSKAEKRRLVDLLTLSLAQAEKLSLDRIHEVVVNICGIDIKTKTRDRESYVGRVIFSYIAILEGYTESTIGAYIDRDHSTVHGMKNEFVCWCQLPTMFKAELKLYEQVRTELNYETDR